MKFPVYGLLVSPERQGSTYKDQEYSSVTSFNKTTKYENKGSKILYPQH